MEQKKRAKTKTIKGATVYTPVKYFNNTGKVPVAFFTISDGREIYNCSAFREFATRASEQMKEGDRGTFEIYPKPDDAGFICSFFLLDKTANASQVQAKRHTTPKDKEITKAYEASLLAQGLVKCVITCDGTPFTVVRRKEECVELSDGTHQPKIEFVMDKLGATVVTARLRSALGLIGKNLPINAVFAEKYQAILAELVSEALLKEAA